MITWSLPCFPSGSIDDEDYDDDDGDDDVDDDNDNVMIKH